jgi:phenylacetate-CoA ligase
MRMIDKFIALHHFRNNHRMSAERVRELQNSKLRTMIIHAYAASPFYRDLMDRSGVGPSDISVVEDLKKLPTLDKADIQKNFNMFLSTVHNPGQCYVRTTSGSSGKMLRVVWDEYNFFSRFLLFYRAFSMIGYNPFKKMVYFLPSVEDPGFTFGLYRQRGVNLDMPFDRVREFLLEYRPHILSLYPSYALDLSSHLSDDDIARIGIEAISLNSEMILDKDRALIEERYRCPVYDEYSCVETGVIASMCKDRGMHIFSDNVIVEILDTGGNPVAPGERGEVVLTALNSFAMPFIRYRIGDISCLSGRACPCGSGMPLLGKIDGRKDDCFTLDRNRHVPAWTIYEAIERPLHRYGDERLVLSDFYLVQRSTDLAEFYYVRGPQFDDEYLPAMIERSRELFGPGFNLRVTELDNIDRVKSVKRKYIHSEIE